MSVTVTPANVAEPQLQASAPTAKPATKSAAPLFDDIAAQTHTPFPSFSGC